ncbi:MAG: hypothetical protein ACE5KM_15240 [Planctomycetaceae bacterium]
MEETTTLDRYDATQSYRFNYDHAPESPSDVEAPGEVPGVWTFCGKPVPSPLGIPAGPLLNGKWVLHYAALGFDVLTYKTVRSVARDCYELPNLQPVATGQLSATETVVPTADTMTGSWAVSFGMPSMTPDVWRADVEWTRRNLPPEKLLSVSVVGSVQSDWSLDDLADDYARCAKWAVQSGADCVESNFSCPNVSTCDGQLYQQPGDAALVAGRIRDAIGDTPYVVKIGSMNDAEAAEELLDAVAPFANALAMTNSVATQVRNADGTLLFDGQRRGICGDATRSASVKQARIFADLIDGKVSAVTVIGVGGIGTAGHVWEYLDAGAEAVHIATAAMVNPQVGLEIRRDLAGAMAADP